MDAERIAVLAKALSHPDRVRLLERLAAVPELSPHEFSEHSGAVLGSAAYHVRALGGAGLIKASRSVQRRGAIEHFYTLTPAGTAALKWARKAPSQ